MPGIKVVIGAKNGKCIQKEIAEDQVGSVFGKKIGDSFSGDLVGLEGYEFQITGGSDNCGFPMRWDITGPGRKKIFSVEGVGVKRHDHGVRIRKSVAGNTISERTAQLNVKVTKEGSTPLPSPPEKKKEGA